MATKCLQIRVEGKVQGVWYRASTKRKAEELGISGMVKNKSDGSVYIEACGEEAALEKLIEWCKQGPELAKVNWVICEQVAPKDYRGFVIVR
ncbi:MAG TPA: acylphosphatase [Phaeodactylibacter sp.]|nr:acylphosphatase [Phaeodactylibacter sp.]